MGELERFHREMREFDRKFGPKDYYDRRLDEKREAERERERKEHKERKEREGREEQLQSAESWRTWAIGLIDERIDAALHAGGLCT